MIFDYPKDLVSIRSDISIASLGVTATSCLMLIIYSIASTVCPRPSDAYDTHSSVAGYPTPRPHRQI